MARPPDVPPELILAVLQERPRPTTAQAARILSELADKEIRPSLIESAIYRHGWGTQHGLEESPKGGRPKKDARQLGYDKSAVDYSLLDGLGEILPKHRKSITYLRMRAVLRVFHLGILYPPGEFYDEAVKSTWRRLAAEEVYDYNPEEGFFTRSAEPWEKGFWVARPRPDDWGVDDQEKV